MSIKSRTSVIVTGITGCLGSQLAKQFIFKGYRFAGFGSSKNKILQLQDEFRNKGVLLVIEVCDNQAVSLWFFDVIRQNKNNFPYIVIHAVSKIDERTCIADYPIEIFKDIISEQLLL
ncbi:hypothetical protein AXG55_02685 [Silvanigrella aquatica]|uniref:Uncharacterized protein n=2 Tax=Silvanigrella aquatica TaxID=1915309 RepID=A0A1L4CY63_9BACT|nr:hypothetical protein AXG55_02685 [Silvanigrella aquatica]